MILLDEERWRLVQADCIEHMATMPDACVDMSIFSPPFPSLFAYTEKAHRVEQDTREQEELFAEMAG